MGKKYVIMKVSPKFAEIVNFIRAKNMIEGNREISICLITETIAEKLNKEDLWYHEFK